MPTFLQPVVLPERCYLEEVLMWVAFQRLPVFDFFSDGEDVRQYDEMEYAPGVVDTPLSDEEAQRVGIPPDPHWIARLNERHLFLPAWYDEFLAKYELEPEQRAQLLAEGEAAAAFEKECQHWRPHYERAIEYPTSKIFIALRDGQLAATGRLLPVLDKEEAIDQLSARDKGLLDIPPTDIPSSF